MKFTTSDGEIDIAIEHVYVAGWTGRDKKAVDHHIEELAAIGITPPSAVPLYYRVSNTLLTQKTTVDVLGDGTSGEVEPLLVQHNGMLWIGLASDHTDRELEAHSVAASKQICVKPAAQSLWKYADVEAHIDSLLLHCSIKENGTWVTYQSGALSGIRPLAELMAGSGFGDNAAMLCGTLSAIGGVRPASEYKMHIEDPVLDKKISLTYNVNKLPVVA